MSLETSQVVFRHTRLKNESPEYLESREQLRLAEIELMRQSERVADLRRHLPPGAAVEDYEFQEGPANLAAGDSPITSVRLGELFGGKDRPVVAYHLMYGKKQTTPCPMCTSLIDGINGIVPHLAQKVDFVVVAAADPPALREHARNRGWGNLRLLSGGTSTFKYDLGSEDAAGNQDSTVSVFTRGADGTLRHFYSAHPSMAPDIHERGLDLLCPLWHALDLTPQGRGDFYAELAYPRGSHGSPR